MFSASELLSAVKSLHALSSDLTEKDLSAYRALLKIRAHESHKNWKNTEAAADELCKILGKPNEARFDAMFERVLRDGNWKGGSESEKPWVVLVSGVNGVRKTTSMYQPWFQKALGLALNEKESADLPFGKNSFFRQLDYMMATLANEEFAKIYEIKDVTEYSEQKAFIFKRYRMLAEMLGVLLLKAARENKFNVMVETSGRDIASFDYVNTFFPADSGYRKLVIHFEINDLSFAEKSVDARMLREMKEGNAALSQGTKAVIDANAGGPYGSAVLTGIQSASDSVWQTVLKDEEKQFEDWQKATFRVEASDEHEWRVYAVRDNKVIETDDVFEIKRREQIEKEEKEAN